MITEGKHLIVDVWLDNNIDFRKLKNAFLTALVKHNQIVVGYKEWEFWPQGESAIYLLAASHASFHTYPENKYITFDVYSCDLSFDAQGFFKQLILELSEDASVLHFNERIISRGIYE
jgi:S-adenosylmethionine/arginine decarboxylase-like enzyme